MTGWSPDTSSIATVDINDRGFPATLLRDRIVVHRRRLTIPTPKQNMRGASSWLASGGMLDRVEAFSLRAALAGEALKLPGTFIL
jgi:hypothetical protein